MGENVFAYPLDLEICMTVFLMPRVGLLSTDCELTCSV